MKELADIARAFDAAQKEGKQTALATVVLVEGSSYRRPGARMLITEDGQLTGAISGGCLEGDALRKALLVMSRRQSMLATYDTMDEDDASLGVGLGCNGIIHILIEPINPDDAYNPVQLIKEAISSRQTSVLVTLFSLQKKKDTQPGTLLLLTEKNGIRAPGENHYLQETLMEDARQVLHAQRSRIKTYENDLYTGFIELIKPAVSLLIAGAGNDAIPVVQMADILGWDCTVIDGRANYATKARFPTAKQVLVSKPQQVFSKVTLDNQTVVLLLTHNYNYDLAMLRQLIAMQAAYVGVLGPKKKLERMLDELRSEGMHLSENQLHKIFGPTGLDIGAETAEEIALSIMAEIKAVLSKRNASFLRNRDSFIHIQDV